MADALRCYGLLVGTWCRAFWQYRTSVLLLTFVSVIFSGLDLVAIVFVFVHTGSIAGFTLPEVLFLYGTSSTSLALADLLMGSAEKLGQRVKDGTFDAMLVRPASTLVQVAADQFAPRRAGRLLQSLAVLAWSVGALDLSWTPDRVLLVPVMVLSGAVIFGAIFVLGAAFQFVAVDAGEVMNAFTYGGNYLTQYPMSIYARELLMAATWAIPLAFVNWQPALHVLSHPDPLGLPAPFRFASPVVAALFATVAGLAWRAGVRHYRSTGS